MSSAASLLQGPRCSRLAMFRHILNRCTSPGSHSQPGHSSDAQCTWHLWGVPSVEKPVNACVSHLPACCRSSAADWLHAAGIGCQAASGSRANSQGCRL